jgi:hypothetical protein
MLLSMPRRGTSIVQRIPHRTLNQILEFTRHSIHDVVNCEIAKREVLGYYKLKCDIQRRCEATDMDRWWNGA